MAKTARMTEKYLDEKRKVGALNPTTAAQYRGVLNRFIEHCPQDPSMIRRRDVVRWMATMRSYSAGTRRFYESTVRGFVGWLVERETLKKDPFAGLPPLAVPPQPVHRALDAAQVAALLAACETRRERFLVLLALHTGLRRAELAALEVGDVSLAGASVHVRHDKGDRPRVVPLSEEAVRVIGAHISSEGLRAGFLLRSETCPERGITPQSVWRIFHAVAQRAGVKIRPGDGVTIHATRHTAATDAHRATGDVLVVQQYLGHAHLGSTERYIARLGHDRMRAAVEGRSYLGVVA